MREFTSNGYYDHGSRRSFVVERVEYPFPACNELVKIDGRIYRVTGVESFAIEKYEGHRYQIAMRVEEILDAEEAKEDR